MRSEVRVVLQAVTAGVIFVLFAIHALRTVRVHRMVRTAETSERLLVALTFIVVALGVLLASIGAVLSAPQPYVAAGLSIARGPMLICGIALLVLDRRTSQRLTPKR